MASHSRFTDEIAYAPVPGAPEITPRTLIELRPEIFDSGSKRKYEGSLAAAEELKAKDLYEKYPPNFRDKNKKFIFKLISEENKYVPAAEKSLLVTRWYSFLPNRLSSNLSGSALQVTFLPDVFTYKHSTDSSPSVEWHLNFANHDLFAYYHGPLLAQDELQVLECIELAALREYFVQTVNTIGSKTTAVDQQGNRTIPTPMLISNAERVIQLDTTKVYGNLFANATDRQLRAACEYLSQPQTVNLIAIEAPSHGYGAYTKEQVEFILFAAFAGFKAAKLLANKTYALNRSQPLPTAANPLPRIRTVINTGWWGCGAYGNSRRMMLITQLLAAHWARVDEIIFHVQSSDYQKDIDRAQEVIPKLLREKTVNDAVREILRLNLRWEKSNQT